MGNVSGLLTVVIFGGFVIFLIYLCCRVKRKGVVVYQQQQAGGQPPVPVGTGQNAVNAAYNQPAYVVATAYPSSATAYPSFPPQHPYNQQGYVINASNQQHVLAYPSPNSYAPSSNLPYPTYDTQNGMPMPTGTTTGPPNPGQFNHNHLQQNASASVPSAPCDDLPPPYYSVVGQTRMQ